MADDGDLPWLSYHFLVCEHDIPSRDFLRSCMEEVEHIFVRLCPSVTKRVDEYLESVIKLAVFTWTCSLFSIDVMSTSNLAHLYNVSTQDIQSVSEAIEVARDVVRGTIAVKLIPRIAAYSVENSSPAVQAPPTEVPALAKDKSPNGSKDKVPGRRRSRTAGADLAMACEKARKTCERLSRKSRHLQEDKPSRRISKNNSSSHSVAIGELNSSRIANTSAQHDTRAGVDSLATIRSREPSPPMHPALAMPSSDRSALSAAGPHAPPPNPPTDVTADAHAAPLSRPGNVPRAAGIRQHDAQSGVPSLSPPIARAIPTVPSPWAVRVPMAEPEPCGSAAAQRMLPPPPHVDDMRKDALEGVAPASRCSPPLLLPAADQFQEDRAAIRPVDDSPSAVHSSPKSVTSCSVITDLPTAASSPARRDASQQPDAPLDHDIPADLPRVEPGDASRTRDIRSATPSRSCSESEEARVEQELAGADDATSPLLSSPRSPQSSSSVLARERSASPELPADPSSAASAEQPLIHNADFRVRPASPPKSAPSLSAALQQTCPPMVPFAPPDPAAPNPTDSAGEPASTITPAARSYAGPPPATAPGPQRVQTLLHHIDAIRDVELRLRVWALENALRFLHNFNGVFPPHCSFADHAGARDGAVEGWARRMRAALVADVRRAEHAVLVYLDARDAVARNEGGAVHGWVVAPAAHGV